MISYIDNDNKPSDIHALNLESENKHASLNSVKLYITQENSLHTAATKSKVTCINSTASFMQNQ